MERLSKKMKILIAVNNSSVGAVRNAVAKTEKDFPGAHISLLVKEKTEKWFKTFFENCAVFSYVEGMTANSAVTLNSFLEEIKSNAFEVFIVVNEKETDRDLRFDLIRCFCGFKKYYIFDAVKNKEIRQYAIFVYLRLGFFGLLMFPVNVILVLCFGILFFLGLPGYLLKGEAKTAVLFFKKNIFNLAGYYFSGLRQAFEKFTLEIFIYLEFVRSAYTRIPVFEKDKIKKILIVKIEHLGDFILAVPMLRALRAEFPEAKISMLVAPWNKAVAEGCPYIDELLIYKTNNPVFNRGRKHPFLFIWMKIFYLKLRRAGFDLCLDFGGWIESLKLVYSSGAKFKGALDYKRVKNIYNIRLADFNGTDNEIIRSFKLLELFDIKGRQEEETEYWITPAEIETAKKMLSEKSIKADDVLAGFYTGASSAPIRWGRENFAKVINALPVKSGFKVIIFNAPGEQLYMEELSAKLTVPHVLMPSDMSLKEFAALVSFCKLFVSNDGGLSHLATAMKVPTITLYGPSNDKEWGPYSKSRVVITKDYPCSPCRKTNCIRNLCMEAIKTEEVLEAVKCGLELTRQA